MRKARSDVFFVLLLLLAVGSYAADTNRLVFKDKIEPHWFSNNTKFWYKNELPKGKREFILVDAAAGERKPAFDHARVAKELATKLNREIDPERLPYDEIRFSEDGKRIRLLGKDSWSFEFEQYSLTEEKVEEPERGETPREERRRGATRRRAAATSPDGKHEIVVKGDNLFLRTGDVEKQLTHDGSPSHSYARSAQRARYVEMRYEEPEDETPQAEVYWAPDSRKFVAMRTRAGAQRTVYMVESSPKTQLQPVLQSYPYAKPGDEIPILKPRLFDLESGKETALDDSLYTNPWSISDIRWGRDSSRFTFLYNQRGHQVLRIISVDAKSGEPKAIIDEKSPTFISYSGKFFCEYLDDTDELIWMSERDGWNHLYLFDYKTGGLKNQITKGEWVVRGVDRVDRETREIWLRAGGIHTEQDPYFIHYVKVSFDGKSLVKLTESNGTHEAQFSPDRKHMVVTWSRVDAAPVTELRRASDGKLVCELEKADIRLLEATGWKAPEPFVAKGRDGATDIYGIIHLPTNLNTRASYPVIESIYAGPHDSFVPKSFRPSYTQEKLTKLGFIVVQMDGMGTSNRSKKFHDVCWKNIADAGFPDRIAWIKAAASKRPYMDLERVGIYGTSAGGQSALGGLLWHPDFYKAGVSDCGCHDNRMDKIWWNEQWMGWPVGPHYDEQSNVTQAHKLQGKLLLMVGELDKNVDPASTMQVVNALIKADKDFELLVVPGGGHGMARTPYGWRRIEEFFVRHLSPSRH
ncbi:MAG TPA: DPP IV N-terminal domain-containing protein [Methylomirabilota bacterium]|nr:DPP IV N-terminal domain-containing protein [Methylomirabilota bacterium]